MADYFTIITAESGVECSQEDYDRLCNVFEQKGDGDGFDENGEYVEATGLTLEYSKERQSLYIYGDEGAANEEHITAEGLKVLGEIIQKAGKKYLEFGAGSYCSKPRPESSGGYYFRVYADGVLRYPKQVWEDNK